MPKVMVVEDESVVAFDIIQELQSAGYEVAGHCVSGDDAIAQAKILQPELILMDVKLQGAIDGITAAEEIGKTLHIPIIFLTAHADEVTLQRAKITRPFGYIIKPFEPNELKANIEITLHRISQTEDTLSEAAATFPIAAEGDFTFDGKSDEWRFEVLRKISLLEGVPDREKQTLARSTAVQTVAAGEYIAMENEKPEFGYVVLSGRLAVAKMTPQGKELTLDLLPPGDFTGIMRALDGIESDSAVRAQIDARILVIPTAQLRAIADRNPAMYKSLSQELLMQVRRTNELALGLAHSRVEDRVISTLVALAPRFGRKGGGNEEQTRIYLTRKELADLTGTTPETAIRVTKNLERQGLLDLSRPGVIKIPSLPLLAEALPSAS